MKKIYLLLSSLITLSSVQAQQWSGPNNTNDLITRSGEIEISGITAKSSSGSPQMNFIRDDGSIGNGAVIGQINFRDPGHWGGLIVARSVGAWGSGWEQAGTKLEFWTQDNTTNSDLGVKMVIDHNGKVGIGTESMGSHRLAVEGSIGAREIKVEASGWSDFVFEDDYELRTLEEVEKFIIKNNHLPEIPNEVTVTENGINLGQMNAKLLQKIEELTLYMINMNKEVEKLKARNADLEKEIKK